MDTPRKRWFFSVHALFSSKRVVGIFAICLILLSIPLTVFIVQQVQEIRQRAEKSSVDGPTSVNTNAIAAPWNYPKSGKKSLPIVGISTKVLLATIPFSSVSCSDKSQGDADCNNIIDLVDLSYWQIDYESDTKRFADFNGDRRVDLGDYAIWRQHSNIPSVPLAKRIADSLGLTKFLSFISWEKLFPGGFRAFAADNSNIVIDSVPSSANGAYQIVNTYEDQTYAIQNIASATVQSKAAYYASTGEQLMQVNNFLESASTTVMQIGTDTVSITRDTSGSVLQVMQDGNGAFLASQVWPNQAAYTRGNAPQGGTVPTSDGFATLSLQPNNAGILTQRDNSGAIVATTQMYGNGTVLQQNYRYDMVTFADSKANFLFINMPNAIGGRATYFFYSGLLVQIDQTDKDGTKYTAKPKSAKNWDLVTEKKNGEKSSKVVDDPVTELNAGTPKPKELMQSIIASARNVKKNKSDFFYGAFNESTVQLKGANSILVVESTSNVLGAKTSKSVLLAANGKTPNSDEITEKTFEGTPYSPTQNGWFQGTFEVSGGSITVNLNSLGQVESMQAHGNQTMSNGNVSVGTNPGSVVTFSSGVSVPQNAQEAESLLNSGQGKVEDASRPVDTAAGAPATPGSSAVPAASTSDVAAVPSAIIGVAGAADVPEPAGTGLPAGTTPAQAGQAAADRANQAAAERGGNISPTLSGTIAGQAAYEEALANGASQTDAQSAASAAASTAARSAGGNASEQIASAATFSGSGDVQGALSSSVEAGNLDSWQAAEASAAQAQAAQEVALGDYQGAQAYADEHPEDIQAQENAQAAQDAYTQSQADFAATNDSVYGSEDDSAEQPTDDETGAPPGSTDPTASVDDSSVTTASDPTGDAPTGDAPTGDAPSDPGAGDGDFSSDSG